MKETYTRREMLKLTGLGIAGAVVATSGVGGVVNAIVDQVKLEGADVEPFFGKHQSGITSTHQSHCYFVALQFTGSSKEELQQLLKMWTSYSERLMQGLPVVDEKLTGYVPPTDTGDSIGLSAANLTLTFGVGPSLFDNASLGLASKKPTALQELPHFPKDQLEEEWSGGDLCIQACANDPQVAFHAVRNLVRAGSGVVSVKWSQAGFLSLPTDGSTPRNLFSFKDGTVNPKTETELKKHVWVTGADQAWMENGTYLVFRRIQMHLETWDRTSLKEQENTFGRYRDSGAAFGQKNEMDEFDFEAVDLNGNKVLPETSHVYLSRKAKATILRRPFSYSTGVVTATGSYDAGLMFISFQKDPQAFIDIQNSLGRLDKLNEYITHRGSALFAVFPGVKKGSYLGEALFTI